MKRAGVFLVLCLALFVLSPSPVVAQDDNTCTPWSTYTVWTVVFCDYSFWNLYEGVKGWVCDLLDLDCGAARGWYGDDPPDDGVWTRWCFLTPEGGVEHCSWSSTFEARSLAVKSELPAGTNGDPPGLVGASPTADGLAYAVLVTPPGTDRVVMFCVWELVAQTSGSTGGKSAASYGGTGHSSSSTGITGALAGTGALLQISRTGEGVSTITGSGFITYTSTGVYTHTHPTHYSDYSNYVRWRLGTTAFTNVSARDAEARSYASCDVSEIRVSGVPIVPGDVHQWFEDNAPIDDIGFAPISWNTLGYTNIVPISTTVNFELGTLVEGECLTIFPAVGPYTVTVGIGPVSVTDFPIGTDHYEVCYSTREFDLVFMDIDIGLLLIVFLGIGGLGALATWLRS